MSELKIGPDQHFIGYLRQGKFMLQRCRADGTYIFYPRVLCPHCGSRELEWAEVSGKGMVYSTTVVRRKAEDGGDYNIALVDLAEGPRMMSRVEGIGPHDVRIGMSVIARIDSGGEGPVVVFSPAETGT